MLVFFLKDVKERSEQLADRYVPLTKEQTVDFKSATKLVTLLRTMMEVGTYDGGWFSIHHLSLTSS